VSLAEYIEAMPKVELHVHLEGSIRPGTLLGLAERNRVDLPANTAEGLRAWYTFTDFSHFIDVYRSIARCICTPDDIELITREFLSGQAAQRIVYTEATYTAFTQWRYGRIPFRDQLAAINRARTWAEKTLGVSMGIVVDIARDLEPEDGLTIADWAIGGMSDGVIALGLAGAEAGFPPEKFAAAFARARSAGLPAVPHAGETAGPESIWGAIHVL